MAFNVKEYEAVEKELRTGYLRGFKPKKMVGDWRIWIYMIPIEDRNLSKPENIFKK